MKPTQTAKKHNHSQLASGIVTVNLSAITNNYRKIQEYCSTVDSNTLVAGVVKADAYGLGMVEVASALIEAGCNIFYVATPEEGIKLRRINNDASIYILDGLFGKCEHIYNQFNLIPCLASIEQIQKWYAWGIKLDCQQPCVIHFNTGINRLGIEYAEFDLLQDELIANLNVDHILSHFASADTVGDAQNFEQINEFQFITKNLPDYKRSFGNSAAITIKELQNIHAYSSNILRPGIGMWGVKTTPNYPINLEPVVEISARILQVFELKSGDKVGYNHYYICHKNIRAAVVAAGYADGLFRSLSASYEKPTGQFQFGEYALPILGKISMDMTVIDISTIPEGLLKEGDFVEIVGKHISLEQLAQWSGTISYEILTNISKRFYRNYI